MVIPCNAFQWELQCRSCILQMRSSSCSWGLSVRCTKVQFYQISFVGDVELYCIPSLKRGKLFVRSQHSVFMGCRLWRVQNGYECKELPHEEVFSESSSCREGGWGEELKGWGDGALRLARVIIVCCRHCQSLLWDRPSILQRITKRRSGALRYISHFQCCNLLSERYGVYYLIQGESVQWLLNVY